MESARPSLFGLEMHLTLMNRIVEQVRPSVVVVDPISALRGPVSEVHAMLLRLVDLLKSNAITALFTNLVGKGEEDESEHGLSSLMDTWIALHDIESNGERNRGLYLLKSRGMSHSNQIREYLLGPGGMTLIEPYIGAAGVLTGSARLAQEASEEAERTRRRQELVRRRREFETRRAEIEHEIAERRRVLDREGGELDTQLAEADDRERALQHDQAAMQARRGTAE